jgi:hypothetical protein
MLVLNWPNSAYIEFSEAEALPLLCHTFEFTLILPQI